MVPRPRCHGSDGFGIELKKAIEKARNEIRRGQWVTLEEIKLKIGNRETIYQ